MTTGMRIVRQRDLTAREAEKITKQIKSAVGDLMMLVARAWQGRVWIALDYGSWADYIKGEFGHAPLSLPREERQAVVELLRGQGMSTRAIGPAVGAAHATVARDLSGVSDETPDLEPVPVTGLDNKNYPVTCTNRDSTPTTAPAARRPKRQAITNSFATSIAKLDKTVIAVERLSQDDRFTKNLDQITCRLSDLVRARDTLQRVIDKFPQHSTNA